jgi:hypothetical protein
MAALSPATSSGLGLETVGDIDRAILYERSRLAEVQAELRRLIAIKQELIAAAGAELLRTADLSPIFAQPRPGATAQERQELADRLARANALLRYAAAEREPLADRLVRLAEGWPELRALRPELPAWPAGLSGLLPTGVSEVEPPHP